MNEKRKKVAVVGAGISGLFASLILAQEGIDVSLFDQNASAGKKWLLATSSGINFSANYDTKNFTKFYGEAEPLFFKLLSDYPKEKLCNFFSDFGCEIKFGSAHRIIATRLSGKEILTQWLKRLGQTKHFNFFPNRRLVDFYIEQNEPNLIFENKVNGEQEWLKFDYVIFAFGGASYKATGSDGEWKKLFEKKNINCSDFEASNCGLEISFSDYFKSRFSFNDKTKKYDYRYLKNCAAFVDKKNRIRCDLTLTPSGMQGLGIYSCISTIRKKLKQNKDAKIYIDLFPDFNEVKLKEKLSIFFKREVSIKSFKKYFSLSDLALELFIESFSKEIFLSALHKKDLEFFVSALKNLSFLVNGLESIERAISTTGGVAFSELDENLMLKKYGKIFCAGEMLDFDCVTGGFLMQAAFSTAHWVAKKISSLN